MTPEDLKKHYGTLYNFRKMTGISTTSLANWLKQGYVPEESQYKIERITKGLFKTEWTKGE